MDKIQVDYDFVEATIVFKEWKGKPSYYVFYHDAGKDPVEEAKLILKNLLLTKGWKRRKPLKVVVSYSIR